MLETSAELESYIKQWSGKPHQQIAEELSSYSLETKHIPDPYHFIIQPNGELISPVTGEKVKQVVKTDTYIGQAELEALVEIENLVGKTTDEGEGVIVWISPPYLGTYFDLKIIVSEVLSQGETRILFNRAVILDLDDEASLSFAQKLSEYSPQKVAFESLEQVRKTPFRLSRPNLHWTYLMEELIDSDQFRMIREGADILAKQQALDEAGRIIPSLFEQKKDADFSGYFGGFRGSCPVIRTNSTPFTYIFENSLVLDRKDKKHPHYCVKCGACGEKIEQVVVPGEQCPLGCGATRKCG